jgi:hypothetical protein
MTLPVQCPACLEQVTKGRHGEPHDALRCIDTKEFRGSMFGGWEEMTYQCQTCRSIVHHTNDKNEVAPFWYFVDKAERACKLMMSDRQFQFNTSALDDCRRLIAAGKAQRWDVVKWGVREGDRPANRQGRSGQNIRCVGLHFSE